MYLADDTLLASLIGALSLVLAVGAVYRWMRHVARMRAEQLRQQGYHLIHALREYSAWIEYQRDLPFTARSLDELTSPEPLTQARRIKREYFPALSQHMVRLLQAHSRVIEYLWQQNLLRLSQGSGWRPAYEDPQYQQLRGAQEDLIGEMIDICRELTGDARQPWRQTGSDFSFSNSLNVSQAGPASGT
jgi:type II secretory pathway pseudopilin PulG